MAKQVYARLDDDRIEQLDAECEKRDVYRPQIVTEAVECISGYKRKSETGI